MKFIIALFVSSLFASIVDDINKDTTSTWWAKEYPPEVITLEKMRNRLIRPWTAHEKHFNNIGRIVRDVPDSFDARDEWGDLIFPVVDFDCGPCLWALPVVETTSDRVGIEGLPSVLYSIQDLLSCDPNNYGCDGGFMDYGWQYVLEYGLALADCIPFTGCSAPCPKTCVNGSDIIRTKATSVYPIPYEIMQTDLLSNGPYGVLFDVYSDFMNYAGGVYQHKSGFLEGGLGALAIGWGVQDGIPYWLIQNSWGVYWGLEGYFLILRGNNECGIEDNSYGGLFV